MKILLCCFSLFLTFELACAQDISVVLGSEDKLSQKERTELQSKAENLKDAEAAMRLSRYYGSNQGDSNAAFGWTRRAALLGHRYGMLDYALDLLETDHPKERELGCYWLHEAIKSGDDRALLRRELKKPADCFTER